MASPRKRQFVFYIITIAVLLAVIGLAVQYGASLSVAAGTSGEPSIAQKPAAGFWKHALGTPTVLFFVQLFVLLLTVRLFSWIFRKLGQPAVIGEIMAGIALGPSLLGQIAPQAGVALFPDTSLPPLSLLSQVGLALFMFVVGMELDTKALRKTAGPAVIISHASIVIPYSLGVLLALRLYSGYSKPGVPFYSFALFMGIAMSVTAFPVLARILKEKALERSRIGTLALSCAAADDVTAWCILALVIATVRAGGLVDALTTIGLTIAYIALLFLVVRPLVSRGMRVAFRGLQLRQSVIAGAVVVLIGSALMAEIIGIHALFGAFAAGVAMPDSAAFREELTKRMESVAMVLLLPLFFVMTGLKTQINLISTWQDALVCIAIIAVAVAGKLGGSALAARITGESARDSLAIGALMNTRGLMELVVLNMGYDLGILNKQLFTMLVLMALATTLMTSPLLGLLRIRGAVEPLNR